MISITRLLLTFFNTMKAVLGVKGVLSFSQDCIESFKNYFFTLSESILTKTNIV